MRIRQVIWTGLLALIGGGALVAPAGAVAVSVRLLPASTAVAPGDTFTVQIAVDAADSVFNAFDAYLAFDSSTVAFVNTVPTAFQIGSLMTSACGNLFHLFTPHPTQLDITCSLLCNQVFVNGPGAVYQVKFRIKPVLFTTTTLSLMPATTFYKAGFTLLPLGTADMTVTNALVGVEQGPSPGPFLEAPSPNPARGSEGPTVAFTLPQTGLARVELFDLTGRKVAGVSERDYPAGRNQVKLDTRGLSTGTYWVRLTDSSGRVASRPWMVLR